jgi:hypothetical protein
MSVEHKSLRDEILFVVGRSSLPLNSGEIYERVTLADEMKQVSNALFQLHAAGKLQRIEGEGRVRYALASGVATPAPAGKAGRPETSAASAAEPPRLDIPAIGDPGIGLDGAAGKARRANPRGEQVAKLLDTDAERLADALIATSREQLDGPKSRWMIDQAGGVSVFSEVGRIILSPLQARMLAKVVMATHAVLEQGA